MTDKVCNIGLPSRLDTNRVERCGSGGVGGGGCHWERYANWKEAVSVSHFQV